MPISSLLKRIRKDDQGATAVEYGLIVALVVIAIISSVQAVADENTGLWALVKEHVDTVMD
jgi:pilus assembly protein Flp/PilA